VTYEYSSFFENNTHQNFVVFVVIYPVFSYAGLSKKAWLQKDYRTTENYLCHRFTKIL